MSKLAANSTLLIAFLQAVLILLVAFGVDFTSAQKDAIIGVLTAALAVIGIWFHPSIPVGDTSGAAAAK